MKHSPEQAFEPEGPSVIPLYSDANGGVSKAFVEQCEDDWLLEQQTQDVDQFEPDFVRRDARGRAMRDERGNVRSARLNGRQFESYWLLGEGEEGPHAAPDEVPRLNHEQAFIDALEHNPYTTPWDPPGRLNEIHYLLSEKLGVKD